MKKIYIIHGWSYNLDKWRNIKPFLRSHGLDPVFLNVPGLTEPSDKVWDIDDYVGWLNKKLRGQKDIIVVGHSNGGRIALNFVNKYPSKISKLILIDSAGVASRSLMSKLKLSVLYVFSKIAKPFSSIKILRKVFYKLIGARDYYEAPVNMRFTMQNMLAADKNLNLKQIKLPASIIWGRQDKITPLKMGKKMKKRIEGSSLFVIDGAKHAPMHTHPEQVADLINEIVNY